jgi:GNAT superfamily N-acetyltransferase
MRYQLRLSSDANDTLRAAVQTPLKKFNDARYGPSQFQTLVVAVHDGSAAAPDGATSDVQGGLWGHTSYGWLYVQLLVVPEPLRGQGVGRQLLQMAEAEALRRGCHGAWLDTFSPQAQGFYENLGYLVFAALADFPIGHSRTFLRKSLAAV